MNLYPSIQGDFWTENGNYWRLMNYIENSYSIESLKDPLIAKKASEAVAEFHFYLKGIDLNLIQTPIPEFLNFNNRIIDYEKALNNADEELLQYAKHEIQCIQNHLVIANEFIEIQNQENISQKIIHADPKISNILFDKTTDNVTAIIDWDTIMPGSILYDFGDMVRSYSNLCKEDGLLENNFSDEVYKNLYDGFAYSSSCEITDFEKDNLFLAAKSVILIQAIRFLTDYLQKDIYYHISYPEQNLNRTKNQLNLLKGIINYENKILNNTSY